jgi:hypothetical protein
MAAARHELENRKELIAQIKTARIRVAAVTVRLTGFHSREDDYYYAEMRLASPLPDQF